MAPNVSKLTDKNRYYSWFRDEPEQRLENEPEKKAREDKAEKPQNGGQCL